MFGSDAGCLDHYCSNLFMITEYLKVSTHLFHFVQHNRHNYYSIKSTDSFFLISIVYCIVYCCTVWSATTLW